MEVVGNVLVDALALLWGNKGSSDEIEVGETEDDGDGEGGADGGVEVGELGLVEVDVDEAQCNKEIDD